MKSILGISALAIGLGLAQPAAAALINGTIGGTIASGTDTLNLFGGGSLVSKSVSVSYSYDPSLFAADPNGICGPSDSCNISRTTGALTVATTIGGSTRTDTSGPVAEVDFFKSGFTGPTVSLYPTLPVSNGNYNYTILNLTLTQMGQIGSPFTPAFTSGTTDRLSFTVNNTTEYLTFTPSVSAVPLPAGLPLFGAGLLALAAARVVTRRTARA